MEQALAVVPQPPAALFAAISDDELTRLGVPPALLPSLRAVRQEEDLAVLLEWLSPECVDSLILLADGHSLAEVLAELEREASAEVDPADVDSALERMDSQAEFIVVTDDEALEAMLSAPAAPTPAATVAPSCMGSALSSGASRTQGRSSDSWLN